jgi:predicted aspartyl protease
MRRLGKILCVIALGASVSQARAADEACQLRRITDVDMGVDASSGGVTVPMTVGGHDLTLLVDTGGVYTTITQAMTDAIGLHRQRVSPNVEIKMFGGQLIDHYVEATNVAFGRLTAPRMLFLVLPDSRHPGIDGLLAPDVMRAYDVDFDFAKAKFSLFAQDHCPGKVVYWIGGTGYAAIPMQLDEVGHIKLPVQLDGKDVDVAIDTGASHSTISLELAEDLFGFDEKSPDLKTVVASAGDRRYRYPFKTLTFAGEDDSGITVSNPDIQLVPDADSKMRHLAVLGMGILRQLHLYVAYKERKLYVSAASAH